ncbi:hypothetical protein C8J56DRAFT_479559 [Mycena floridula]|nr:hypothetical protein C8J56DRAFT_479559 [Mycena floridula]
MPFESQLQMCGYQDILRAFVQVMGHYEDGDRAGQCIASLYRDANAACDEITCPFKEQIALYYAQNIPTERHKSLALVLNTVLDIFRHRRFDSLPDASDLAFSASTDEVTGRNSRDPASKKTIFTQWHVNSSRASSDSSSSTASSRSSGYSGHREKSLLGFSDSYHLNKIRAAFADLAPKPLVNHVIRVIMEDDSLLSIWCHNRESTILSSSVDIKAEPAHLVVLVVLFQRFSESDWGSSDAIRTSSNGMTTFIVNGRSFVGLIPAGYSAHRKTFTLPVVEELDPDAQCFLKASFSDAGQCGEAVILKQCHSLAAGDDMVLHHIPKLVASQDFVETTSIFTLLGFPTRRPKLLRILVFERLEPITVLKDDLFWQAFWDIVRCHYLLWQLGVHHRDISVNNLMYNPRTKKGILNDFDLAIVVDPDETSPTALTKHSPTGTLPFMAMELLSESGEPGCKGQIAHLYRHDLESFSWVFLWICRDKKKVNEKSLGWSVDEAQTAWGRKFCDTMEDFRAHPDYAHYERAAKGMIYSWRNLERKRIANVHPTAEIPMFQDTSQPPPYREFPDALYLQGMLALVNSVEGLHVDLGIPLPEISVLLQSPKESQLQ